MTKNTNTRTTNKAQAMLDGFTPAERAAAERLAVLNHCTPADMLARMQASARRTAAKPEALPDIGVPPATGDEVLAAARRQAKREGCTPDEVLARARAAMRRVSRRSKRPDWNPLTGLDAATAAEERRIDERLAKADGITVRQVQARARAVTHTSNVLLAGDRQRVSRFVRQVLANLPAGDHTEALPGLAGQVLALAAQGSSRAEITSALLRKGVRV